MGSITGPVLHALGAAVLGGATQAHDNDAVLLPDHLPEVTGRVLQRTLTSYVGRVLRVIVSDEASVDVVAARLVLLLEYHSIMVI